MTDDRTKHNAAVLERTCRTFADEVLEHARRFPFCKAELKVSVQNGQVKLSEFTLSRSTLNDG